MIDPHGVADDFRREAVSAVIGSGAVHEMSLAGGCQVDKTLDIRLPLEMRRNPAVESP